MDASTPQSTDADSLRDLVFKGLDRFVKFRESRVPTSDLESLYLASDLLQTDYFLRSAIVEKLIPLVEEWKGRQKAAALTDSHG